MTVDIQEKMKQEVNSFEDLGTLIEQCFDNFENLILPKLPKSKVKVEPIDEVSKGKEAKKPFTLNTEESFDEKMFLRDFSKSKVGKEDGNVDFSDLFDHCLKSYKKPKLKQEGNLKHDRSREDPERKNHKEFKTFASSLAQKSRTRRDLSDNVLDRNFRHQLQHKLQSRKQEKDLNTQNPDLTWDAASDFENKQNKQKDAAVRSEKENKIKKLEIENRISSTRKTQPLQKTMQRKRLLGQ